MEAYKKVIWASTILAAVITLLMIGYFFIYRETPPPPAPAVLDEPVSKPSPPLKEPITSEPAPWLPAMDIELNQSDWVIREVMPKISDHPALPGWLKSPDLIRRFVAVTDNIARGENPAPHLQDLRPLEKFTIIKKGTTLYIDPESYSRYDLAVTVFSSIDNEKLARLYKESLALLDKAYSELGYPSNEFSATLARAIAVILQVPVIQGEIRVREKVMSYAYWEPKLERLSVPQKHLLRMGPQNIRKIQAKLRQLLPLLDLPN